MPDSSLLRRYTLAHSDNYADLVNAVSQTYGCPVRPLGPPNPRTVYDFRAIRGVQFTVGLVSSDVGVHAGQLDGSYVVNLGVTGEVRTERRGERMVNTARNVAVFNPGDRQLLLPEPCGSKSLGIRLSRELIDKELTALLGRPQDGPVCFDFTADLTEPHSQALRVVLNAMLQQWSSDDDLFRHPAFQLAQMRSLTISLLLSHRHNFSEALESGHSPLRPRPLRRALDYIEANLGEHLTMADIAAAAGCSAKTVTEAFHDHLGVTPMTHVRQRRLERVREDLLNGNDSIGMVATRWGFGHLGRFALSYRQHFGEQPSDTLRRR